MFESINPIRAIVLLFSLFALSRVYLRFQNNVLGSIGFITWTVIWILIPVFIFIPGLSDAIAARLGGGRGAETFFTLAIIVLLYSVYKIYVKIDSLEKEVTRIVRERALDHVKR